MIVVLLVVVVVVVVVLVLVVVIVVLVVVVVVVVVFVVVVVVVVVVAVVVVLLIIFAEFLFNLFWFVSLPQIRFIPFFVGRFYAHKSWGSRFVCVIYKGHESPTSNRILKNPSGSHRRKQAISAYDVTMKSHAAGIHIPWTELLVRRRFETV